MNSLSHSTCLSLFTLTIDTLPSNGVLACTVPFKTLISSCGTFKTMNKRTEKWGGQYFQRFTSRLSILSTLPTLHTLVSVRISCVLLFIHLLLQWQKEVVYQSRAYLVIDHLLYSHNLSVWFRADNVGRNQMLITLKGLGVEAVFLFYRSHQNRLDI